MTSQRLHLLRRRLEKDGLGAIIITQADNRRYLSGFVGSAGFLFVSASEALLATDFRYTEQAASQAPDFEVIEVKGEMAKWLPPVLSRLGVERVGFESADVTVAAFQRLKGCLKDLPESRIQLVATENVVESLRSVKDGVEVECIRKACALTDAAFEFISPELKPGMTEKEVAWQLEKHMRQNGSEVMPFDIIVASGPNAALPHAHPTDRIIGAGEPIIFDLGARVGGYCSDLSRTICLGDPDNKFPGVYDLTLTAQLAGVALIKPGMTGAQADALSRTVIEKGGHGPNFGHGLGHGVGLAVHEAPRLGSGSSDVIEDGMVFTVEPGIYLPGWGGVRIEDTVICEGGKLKTLTKANKQRC